MSETEKKKSPIKTIISSILYGILIVFVAFSIIMNITKKNNEMITVFGYTFAVIQSGSMEAGGYNIGDCVLVKEVNPESLRVGDIIVFYMIDDAADDFVTKTNISDNPETHYEKVDVSHLNRADKQEAIDAGQRLIFHRIINIFVDEYGYRFFETKGDSNPSSDGLTRETFVCAKYIASNKVVSSIFSFVSSPVGLICVILIPVSYIVILQILGFIQEMKYCKSVGDLVSRKKRLSEIDTKKCKIANYLSPAEKIYLYDITPDEDKNDMAIILWDESIDEVLKVYQKDRQEYYDYLALNLNAKEKERLELLKAKADLIKEDPNINEEDAVYRAKKTIRRE